MLSQKRSSFFFNENHLLTSGFYSWAHFQLKIVMSLKISTHQKINVHYIHALSTRMERLYDWCHNQMSESNLKSFHKKKKKSNLKWSLTFSRIFIIYTNVHITLETREHLRLCITSKELFGLVSELKYETFYRITKDLESTIHNNIRRWKIQGHNFI